MEEEPWSLYLAKFGAKVGAKVLINMYAPGFGASIEFVDAVKCFYDGDITGGVINTLSGIGDLASFGLVGSIKEVMRGGAKATVVATVKEMGKLAPKEVTKKLGQQAGKEIAKGVLNEATEEVWRQNAKMTLNKAGVGAFLAFLSSGGHQVSKTVYEDLSEKIAFEMMAKSTKMGAFELTKDAAKEGAKKEFMKKSYILFQKDLFFAASKGIVNRYGRKEDDEDDEDSRNGTICYQTYVN
ncbi:uncharacterized protein LOC144639400 [Oculina patagonica]